MNSLKKKSTGFWSKLRMPHAFTMLFVILIFLGVISLIMAYAGTSYEKKEGEKISIIGAGILDWFSTIPAGFVDAIWIILFLLVLGGFINVVVKTQALEALIGKIATKFKTDYHVVNKESFVSANATGKKFLMQHAVYYYNFLKEGLHHTWVIIPLMLFFSFAGTTYGMAEESLAFYAIIVPLVLAAGFDVYTGFLIVFVGAGVGVMGSTINPFSIMSAVSDLKEEGIVVQGGESWRWFAWCFFTFVTIVFVMVYAARVKMNKNNSALKDLFEIHEKTFKVAVIGHLAPILTKRRLATVIIFISVFIFMVFTMITNLPNEYPGIADFETNTFGNKPGSFWFHNNKITSALNKNPDYLGKEWIYDWTFGRWYFGALVSYFFIASLVIAAINWRGEKNYIQEMVDGGRDMLGVAFAIGIARAISVLLEVTNMKGYFVTHLSGAISDSAGDKKITVPLVAYILFIPLTFLIPSTSGLASAAFPILGPAVNAAEPAALSGTITGYAWAAGFANMFVPTYGVVIGALALTKIPFGNFLRAIWKYLALIFVVGLVMIILGGAISSPIF